MKFTFRKFIFPALFLLLFTGIALWRFFATEYSFYLYNFIYLGLAIAIGIFLFDTLPPRHMQWGRRVTQLLVGIYLLGYVGIIQRENMQIEGFFAYLAAGIFAGATLHYLIAKVAGPLIFGRGWCGWACWTAMVLDLLPWKRSPGRYLRAGKFRYIHFFLSLVLVVALIIWLGRFDVYSSGRGELLWLLTGNGVYYLTSVGLAIFLKDNRAFCKYVCPIPTLQKIPGRLSILKIRVDPEKCTRCGLCETRCPMDIKLLRYAGRGMRVTSTECIFCQTCTQVCPQGAVAVTAGFDIKGLKDGLRDR